MPTSAIATKVVLIAADALPIRERFASALEQAGHRVISIASAGELLARVRFDDSERDLLILDLHLSNSAGTDLVAAIRRLDDGGPPILVFSGSVSTADCVRELSRLGVSGYLNEHCGTPQILAAVAPHLFPGDFNRCQHPRLVLGIPVQYRVGATMSVALTLNLGHGGIGIRTTSPLFAGTHVRVRFKLPGTDHEVEADGHLAWSHHRLGMGIQFEAMDAESQAHIDAAVGEHLLTGPGESQT